MNRVWCWLFKHKYVCLNMDDDKVYIVCTHCGHTRMIYRKARL